MNVSKQTSWIWLWFVYLGSTISCIVQVRNDVKRHQDYLSVEGASDSDRNDNSNGDRTRTLFYRLLCLALLSRTSFIPAEMMVSLSSVQLLAETFPEMAFASAWTLLISFFVQLVGTASGSNTFSKPRALAQSIFYVLYAALILMDTWNEQASSLVYVLLCCIYTALFGTLLYFGPRLVTMLRPSLEHRSGLAYRLVACCTIANAGGISAILCGVKWYVEEEQVQESGCGALVLVGAEHWRLFGRATLRTEI